MFFLPFLLISSLLLTFCLSQAGTNTYIIGQVSQRDTNRPVYNVQFPQPNTAKPSIPEPEQHTVSTLYVNTARKQRLRCLVPSPDALATPEPSSENPFHDIDDLLRVYSGKCFFYKESWWTYEFCYGRHIVQKHLVGNGQQTSPDEREEEYVLGRFDPQLDIQRRQNASHVSTDDAAFTQLYTNGTICDLTGKPRQTIVKYMCSHDVVQLGGVSKDTIAVLNFIREVASCVYEIHFINTAICAHRSYQEKAQRSARIIHCSSDDGLPFSGLEPDKDTHFATTLNL